MTDETTLPPDYLRYQPGTDEPAHSLGPVGSALKNSGLLWALNECVLHARGYEAVIDGGELKIKGVGALCRTWCDVDPDDLDRAWRSFRQTLLTSHTANRRTYEERRPRGGQANVAARTMLGR
jgi:hypothetical protein